jgi:hypothetical protein
MTAACSANAAGDRSCDVAGSAASRGPADWLSLAAAPIQNKSITPTIRNDRLEQADDATSMELADGTLGRPGMVMISPQIATMNSAPAESRTSRTGMLKPVGAPLASGLVENEYCVLAMQTGSLPKPISSQVLS